MENLPGATDLQRKGETEQPVAEEVTSCNAMNNASNHPKNKIIAKKHQDNFISETV